jgi:hypothetical protein
MGDREMGDQGEYHNELIGMFDAIRLFPGEICGWDQLIPLDQWNKEKYDDRELVFGGSISVTIASYWQTTKVWSILTKSIFTVIS